MKIKKIRNALIVILAVIFLISTFNIIKITYDYKLAEKTNSKLQEQYVQEINPTNDEEKLQMSISIDFDALKQKNSYITGWIYCPDTPINYPVVQGKDNNQYLRTDLQGKYLASGTIFVDYRNGNIGDDRNYIVYGHNMKNGTMFGTMVKYKEQSYYDAHPILYFLTPECNYIIELCAGAVINRDSNIYQQSPDTKTVENIISKSTFLSNTKITESDNLITLSTCSYEFNNARYVLLGKLNKI